MVHLKPPFHLFCVELTGPFGTPLRGLPTSGRSPHVLFSVGPTVRIPSVHRFAASLLPAGPPTSYLASGPPSGSLRYTASRPPYFRPVPPRRHLLGCLRRCP